MTVERPFADGGEVRCMDADRLRDTLRDASVRRAAMRRHVERCRSCREAALAQDPTTLFRRLPKVELSADEVAEMRQRVKGVQRARRVGGAHRPAGSIRSAWAAAAGMVCVLGGLAAFQASTNPTAAPLNQTVAAGTTGDRPVLSALSAEDEAHLDRALASRALIEGDDVLSEQVVLMQVAGRASDLAWVANDRLDL